MIYSKLCLLKLTLDRNIVLRLYNAVDSTVLDPRKVTGIMYEPTIPEG